MFHGIVSDIISCFTKSPTQNSFPQDNIQQLILKLTAPISPRLPHALTLIAHIGQTRAQSAAAGTQHQAARPTVVSPAQHREARGAQHTVGGVAVGYPVRLHGAEQRLRGNRRVHHRRRRRRLRWRRLRLLVGELQLVPCVLLQLQLGGDLRVAAHVRQCVGGHRGDRLRLLTGAGGWLRGWRRRCLLVGRAVGAERFDDEAAACAGALRIGLGTGRGRNGDNCTRGEKWEKGVHR